MHEWTYDAMCHDLLDMDGNKYAYEVSLHVVFVFSPYMFAFSFPPPPFPLFVFLFFILMDSIYFILGSQQKRWSN